MHADLQGGDVPVRRRDARAKLSAPRSQFVQPVLENPDLVRMSLRL